MNPSICQWEYTPTCIFNIWSRSPSCRYHVQVFHCSFSFRFPFLFQPFRIQYSSVKRRHSVRIRCRASVQDLTLSISSTVYRPFSSLFVAFFHRFTVLCHSVVSAFPVLFYNTLQCYLLSLDVIRCASFIVILSFMVILVSPSHRSVPSSLTVVFFCHNVELSIKIIRSCLVRRIWFMLLCHVVVSSLLVIPVNVSRCQLSLKLFNHLSIVGICLATLFYRLPRFVLLTIVSRF